LWHITPSSVSVNLSQSGLALNLVETFSIQNRNQTPTATPYQSDISIDAVAPLLKDQNFPALKQRKDTYQSLIESIGWLAHSTHPDLSAVHSFLSAYSNKPSTVKESGSSCS
jgi:hypothetical protein